MKPGPYSAKEKLLAIIDVTSPPSTAEDWLVKISLENEWFLNEDDAREAADRWRDRFLSHLQITLDKYTEAGRFAPFSFNSSSNYYIQGCAFVEPKDSTAIKAAKLRRSRFKEYAISLKKLTPSQFEALCVGLLSILGVQRPVKTQHSVDEGIDFYGQIKFESIFFPADYFPNVQKQITAWMIGQAKHYQEGKVSTFEIRDLVGAIELAKGHAYSALKEKYEDLKVKVCEPVFYLFFTTGRMSSNSWHLLERSGVIGMDGEMIAGFLAEREIGFESDNFNEEKFLFWVDSFLESS